MKKILLVMLCLLIAVSSGACAPEDENITKAKNLWGEENVIFSSDGATFELTPGLISWFYQYTQANCLYAGVFSSRKAGLGRFNKVYIPYVYAREKYY